MSRRRTEAFLKRRYIYLHRGIRRHTDKLVKNTHKMRISPDRAAKGKQEFIKRIKNLFRG